MLPFMAYQATCTQQFHFFLFSLFSFCFGKGKSIWIIFDIIIWTKSFKWGISQRNEIKWDINNAWLHILSPVLFFRFALFLFALLDVYSIKRGVIILCTFCSSSEFISWFPLIWINPFKSSSEAISFGKEGCCANVNVRAGKLNVLHLVAREAAALDVAYYIFMITIEWVRMAYAALGYLKCIHTLVCQHIIIYDHKYQHMYTGIQTHKHVHSTGNVAQHLF